MESRQLPEKSLRSRLLQFFGLTDELVIKVYHGYGHAEQLVIFGHVFSLSPLPRKKYRKSVLFNAMALLRLFMVRPVGEVSLQMDWQGRRLTATADKEGFFKFEWKDEPPLEHGLHPVVVQMLNEKNEVVKEGKGTVYIP